MNETPASPGIDLLLELNMLLRKMRDEQSEKKVNALFRTEENVSILIQKIREIDSGQKGSPVKTDTLEPSKAFKPVEFVKKSLFYFILKSRSAILAFAKETGIIRGRFWGLSYFYSEETNAHMNSIFDEASTKYLEVLNSMVMKSWEFLDIPSYNAVFTFNELISMYVKKYVRDDLNHYNNYLFTQNIVDLFLTLMKNDKTYLLIQKAVISSSGISDKSEIDLFIGFVGRVLSGKNKISIKNFILAVFSIQYRDRIFFDDLYLQKEITPIPENHFLTNHKTRQLMHDYSDSLKEKIKSIEKKLFLAKFVDESGKLVEDIIREKKISRYNIEFFGTNVMESASAFLFSFLTYIKPLFRGEVDLSSQSGKKRAVVFSGVMDEFIEKCDTLITEASYIKRDSLHTIDMTLYAHYLNSNHHLESQKEEKECELIHNITIKIHFFFINISKLLYDDYVLTNDEPKDKSFDKIENRNRPVTSFSMPPRFIPYSEMTLDHYGLSVIQTLGRMAAIAATYLNKINHPEITDVLSRKNVLIEDYKKLTSRLMLFKF